MFPKYRGEILARTEAAPNCDLGNRCPRIIGQDLTSPLDPTGIEIFRWRHIRYFVTVMSKSATTQATLFGHQVQRPRLIEMAI